jgi:glyoxylase-like metal-dependent hydrolase (beta-lactamase superfamily II)
LVAAGTAIACDMMEYKRVQASPHVHVFEAAEGTTAVVNGNIVAVIGKEEILVVDTGQIASVARRAVADIRRLSPLPVRYIVNTHWHGDHLLGNFVFKEAFPGARIVAHSHTIAEGARFYTDYAATARTRLPAARETMRKRGEASTSADERLWISKTLECIDRVLPEIDGVRYQPPDLAVDDELKVDLGGLAVMVKHIGAGNTPGDLIVWVEADRLAVVGDMVVSPVPYAIGSALEPWTRTMASLRKLGATTYVPGHGPVMRDDSYIRDVEALLADTRRQLEAMQAKGVSKSDAEKRLDAGAFRNRYITTPMRRQAFEQFFVKPAVAQAWPKDPAPPAK